jgi:hypothetical protein
LYTFVEREERGEGHEKGRCDGERQRGRGRRGITWATHVPLEEPTNKVHHRSSDDVIRCDENNKRKERLGFVMNLEVLNVSRIRRDGDDRRDEHERAAGDDEIEDHI